jgi:hypothetical protein
MSLMIVFVVFFLSIVKLCKLNISNGIDDIYNRISNRYIKYLCSRNSTSIIFNNYIKTITIMITSRKVIITIE